MIDDSVADETCKMSRQQELYPRHLIVIHVEKILAILFYCLYIYISHNTCMIKFIIN